MSSSYKFKIRTSIYESKILTRNKKFSIISKGRMLMLSKGGK